MLLNLDLLHKNDRLIVAVSGGIDSMVLLDLLVKLNIEYALTIIVCHVNHHKRQASASDAAFVRETAAKLNLEYEEFDYHHDGNANFHTVSRKARLAFFLAMARKHKADKIVLAHHADDLVETVLMRLVRGSSFAGYGGIREQLQFEGVTLIRPLLSVSRAEIENYQKQEDIDYREDASNLEDDYTRNRIRHHLLPFLQAENPQYPEKFSQFSTYIQEADEHLRKQADAFVAAHVKFAEGEAEVAIAALRNTDRIVQRYVLIAVIERLGGANIEVSFTQLASLILLIGSHKTRLELDIAESLKVLKSYDELLFYRKLPTYPEYDCVLDGPEKLVLPTGDIIAAGENTANLHGKSLELWYNDLDFIFPLAIRNRRAGDRITLPYGTKKLKTFLSEKRVPHADRDRLPLVFAKNGQLLWIPGYYVAPTVRGTKKICLCYQKGN